MRMNKRYITMNCMRERERREIVRLLEAILAEEKIIKMIGAEVANE